MANYRNFDEIMNARNVFPVDRLMFARKWLSDNYGVNNPDEQWLNDFTDVHDHDGAPKHFGQIKIGTAFGALMTQLVKIENTWHVGVVKPNSEQGIIIHPKSEASSTHPDNMKEMLNFVRVVQTGKVLQQPVFSGNEYQTVAPLTSQEVYAQQDAEDGFNDDVASAPADITSTRTQSVGVDLSAWLK